MNGFLHPTGRDAGRAGAAPAHHRVPPGRRRLAASAELHRLRLYPRQEVLDDLASAGFQTRLLAGYGSDARFRRGHAGILAIKPSNEMS